MDRIFLLNTNDGREGARQNFNSIPNQNFVSLFMAILFSHICFSFLKISFLQISVLTIYKIK